MEKSRQAAIFRKFFFLPGTVRILLFLMPSLAYLVTSRWDIVYRDCFSPFEIACDMISTLVTFWLYAFGAEHSNAGSMFVLALGCGLTTMSMALYFIYRTLSGGDTFVGHNAKYWFYYLMAFVMGGSFVTLLGLSMEDNADETGYQGFAVSTMRRIWFLAPAAEVVKVVYPICIRVRKGGYTPEGWRVFNVKQCQAVLTIGVSVFEIFDLNMGESSGTETVRHLKLISWTAGTCALVQFIIRLFEPKEVRDARDAMENQQRFGVIGRFQGNVPAPTAEQQRRQLEAIASQLQQAREPEARAPPDQQPEVSSTP